ncbi:hypothetical protein [Actinopolymorpha pittospori]
MKLLRREDMVVLEFTFTNLSRVGEPGAQRLRATNASVPAYLSVLFPPQAVLEQATPPTAPSTGVKGAWLSGPSRVVFQVPSGTSIPFTASGLLTWTGLQNVVSKTSLECVWGLPFALTSTPTTWSHGTEPVTSPTGVTGLWHTALTRPTNPPNGSAPAGPARVQPVPLVSGGPPRLDQPFTAALNGTQRQQIANALARRPVQAQELVLSALGATVDLAGDWSGVPGVAVVGYRHRAVIGRDSLVHLEQRGYLLPFGFPAKIVSHTERRLDLGLVKTSRLTVLLPEVVYPPDAVGLPHGGRAFPFAQVRLDSPLTADVTDQTETFGQQTGFWVRGGEEADGRLRFSLTGVDRRGHPVTFNAPLVFIFGDKAYQGLDLAAYEQKASTIVLPAAGSLELAPTAPAAESSTVQVLSLRIGAEAATADAASLQAAGRLAAYPRLLSVEARVPALTTFPASTATTLATTSAGPVQLILDGTYVAKGLDEARHVYAKLQTPVGFAPSVTDSGGVAKLDQQVSGLSTTAGLVGGDLDTFKSGSFNPSSYFPPPPSDPGAVPPTRLLGFLNLRDLVEPTNTGDGEAVPRILTEVIRPAGGPKPPEAVRSTLIWRPKLKVGTYGGVLQIAPATTLELRNTTTVRYDGTPPQVDSRGELRAVVLSFASGILLVNFERLAFTTKPGASPSLDVAVKDVQFGGDLHFLDRLRHYLRSPANGPRIKVDPTGIEIAYGLAIPSVGFGVFMMQNLVLSTSAILPFDGTAIRARFALSARDHPFLVTVSLFGGGGFFAVTVQSEKIVELEAQLEFGAAAALNLGVASGSVSVTAGIYIRLEAEGYTLSGFFRAVGALDVLGIISVSIEFYLALTLESGGKVTGVAEVTVRVRVAFFSQSVTLTVERSFHSGAGQTLAQVEATPKPLSFAETFPNPQPWRERCAAFARMAG